MDIGHYTQVPGARVSPWFAGYAVDDAGGEPPSATAAGWIMQMCDGGLSLYGYEQTLLTLGP